MREGVSINQREAEKVISIMRKPTSGKFIGETVDIFNKIKTYRRHIKPIFVKTVASCLVAPLFAAATVGLSHAGTLQVSAQNQTTVSNVSIVSPPAATSEAPMAIATNKKKIGIVMFPDFETLDVFGPVEMWGNLPDYQILMVSEHGGPVKSAQGIETLATYSFDTAPQFDILMVPGGVGTRTEVNNPAMLAFLRKQDKGTEWTTSVCTGSAVLAKAGILKGHKATSNKLAYAFATSQDRDVQWQGNARWVTDGKYVTSSGVSAGTDMALWLVERLYGRRFAETTAREAEYAWNSDPAVDPFSVDKTK